MLPRVSDCALVLRLVAKQEMTSCTTYALPPKFPLLCLITQKHVKFGNECTPTTLRGVSVFAINFVRKIFRPGKYLSRPDLLWGSPNLYSMGDVIKIKRPGRESTVFPASSADVKEESYGSTIRSLFCCFRTRKINP